MELSEAERELLLEALEAHLYWDVSEEHYRKDARVRAPGADDPEKLAQIRLIEDLGRKLGGDSGLVHHLDCEGDGNCSCHELWWKSRHDAR